VRRIDGHRPLPGTGRFFRGSVLVCIALIALASLYSCKDNLTGTGPFDIVFPDSNISYNSVIQPLFDKGCALAGGCHAGDQPAADLGLESYQRLTDRVGIVVPGSPDESLLQLRIEGRIEPRMPLFRPALTDNQIQGIRRWILEGAINN